MRAIIVSLLFVFTFACVANGEDVVSYQPMNSSVEILFNSDGSDWEKIMAFGEADLKFGDRTDIRQATKKATLRAKAELSKFMKERISTEETSEEITKLLSKTTSNGQDVSEENTRKIVDTTIEKIVNQSNAILKGILVLENNINKKNKYVRVTVGVSRKTQGIADSLADSFKQKTLTKKEHATSNTTKDSGDVVRRSNNYNNF